MTVIYSWTERRIRSYLDASKYTSFHHELATYIIPLLNKNDSVFDFGCGLGQLDIEIAPYVKQVKGFDASDIAIAAFQQNVEEKSIVNIESVYQNTETVTEQCDVGIMSFFGMGWTQIERYYNLCSKSLITIFNWENESTLYPSNYRQTRKLTGMSLVSLLEEQKIKFDYNILELEFGQPFRTREEAVQFVEDFAPKVSKEECETFLEENLVEENQSKFQYYLPNKKKLGVFYIKR